MRRVIDLLKPLYKPISTPHTLYSYNREAYWWYITALLPEIKRDAGPGIPYSKKYRTNGDLLDYATPYLINTTLDRIELMMNTSLADIKAMTPEELVKGNYMDPVRLFIKNEPHKREKCIQKRFRLIMSVSIVDKLIEMVLGKHYNKAQIASWREIPSKPGMGFSDEAIASLIGAVKDHGVEKLAAADISGWDWSVPSWLLELEARFRTELNSCKTEYYQGMLYKKAHIEANSVYSLSDGVLMKLNFSGVQNSGKYNTSSSNSFMRLAAAVLIGADWGFAMGDDCIESYVPNAIERYSRFGFQAKMYEPIGNLENGFEFCSHIYSLKGAYSVNIVRGMMTLLNHKDPTPLEKRLLTLQFEDDYNSSPDWKEAAEGLERVGWYA